MASYKHICHDKTGLVSLAVPHVSELTPDAVIPALLIKNIIRYYTSQLMSFYLPQKIAFASLI